jgi:hypothetical protein
VEQAAARLVLYSGRPAARSATVNGTAISGAGSRSTPAPNRQYLQWLFWRDLYGQLRDPFAVLWVMNQQKRQPAGRATGVSQIQKIWPFL